MTDPMPMLEVCGAPIRFSVCIPNFNYANYLRLTIASVLAQTYPHFEIIVADNASTDDSVRVVESFNDPRIRLVVNRYNVGFSANLDRASETAKYEYMLLLSSDDLMQPDALATYAKVLQSQGDQARMTVLTSAIDVVDSDGNLIGVSYRSRGSLFYQELDPQGAAEISWPDLPVESTPGLVALRETLRAKHSPAVFLATCYSRALYGQVEGYHNSYRMFPDGHFLNKLLSQDPVLVYVPQRLFSYRVHPQNQTANEAATGALKYQVDAYMLTVETPSDVLQEIGMQRHELVQVFIEKAIMKTGLQAIAAGHWVKAFRCLAFGFASYPGASLRQFKTYVLAGLLLLGPLGWWLAAKLHARRSKAKRREAHR